MKTHFEKRSNVTFECKDCNKKYTFKSDLSKHRKKIHNGIKDKKCDECEFSTFGQSDLRRHKQSNHGTVKFQCSVCQFEGKTEYSLNAHKRNKRITLISRD